MSRYQIKDQMKLKSMHRRQFGRIAMGALTVVGLAACGGGGGGEEDEEYPLRQAYDKINLGMTKEEVLAVMGRYPEGNDGGVWDYRASNESLMIHYGPYRDTQGVRVIGVNWSTSTRVPSLSLGK